MNRRRYQSPIFMISSGGGGSEFGDGSNQGSIIPDPQEGAMPFDEWWTDIAWEGDNPDADYNGDGTVNQADYEYYIENELWKG